MLFLLQRRVHEGAVVARVHGRLLELLVTLGLDLFHFNAAALKENSLQIQVALGETHHCLDHVGGGVNELIHLKTIVLLEAVFNDERKFSAAENNLRAARILKFLEDLVEVGNDGDFVARLDSVDDILHEILTLRRWQDGLDAARGQASLVELGFDAATATKNTTLHGSVVFADSLHDRVRRDLDEAEEWHVVTTTLDHVVLEGVRSVAGTNDEVNLSSGQVGSHLTQGRSTVFASAKDCFVAVGYSRVHLDDRMDVVLVSCCMVEFLGLLKNDLHEVDGSLGTETTNDTARELLTMTAVERRAEARDTDGVITTVTTGVVITGEHMRVVIIDAEVVGTARPPELLGCRRHLLHGEDRVIGFLFLLNCVGQIFRRFVLLGGELGVEFEGFHFGI